MSSGVRPYRWVRPYAWVLGLLWGVPATIVLLGYLVLSKDVPPEQCEGIGFGCTLSPADTLALLGMMAAPFLAGAGAVAVVLIALVRGRSRSRQDG